MLGELCVEAHEGGCWTGNTGPVGTLHCSENGSDGRIHFQEGEGCSTADFVEGAYGGAAAVCPNVRARVPYTHPYKVSSSLGNLLCD